MEEVPCSTLPELEESGLPAAPAGNSENCRGFLTSRILISSGDKAGIFFCSLPVISLPDATAIF